MDARLSTGYGDVANPVWAKGSGPGLPRGSSPRVDVVSVLSEGGPREAPA